MATYIFSIIGLVALCACWAIFQLKLNKQDPGADKPPVQCGGCDERCER